MLSSTAMNQQICRVFNQLKQLRLSQGEEWRAKAYERAIATIEQHPTQILSGKEAKSLPGIGQSLATKIDEILRTGTLAELQFPQSEEDTEKKAVIELFMTIERVGYKTAEKWYNAGYRTLADIPREHCTEAQWVCIQLYPHLIQRIPRSEITYAERILHEYLGPRGIEFQICGSYRRGRLDSGDIDVLVIDQPGRNIINEVISCPIFKYQLASGVKKFLGICQIDALYRRIDVELVRPEEYPYAVVYFTGPTTFNVKMRDYASQLGCRLNEKSLIDQQGNPRVVNTECDVFQLLGLDYLTPEERDKC